MFTRTEWQYSFTGAITIEYCKYNVFVQIAYTFLCEFVIYVTLVVLIRLYRSEYHYEKSVSSERLNHSSKASIYKQFFWGSEVYICLDTNMFNLKTTCIYSRVDWFRSALLQKIQSELHLDKYTFSVTQSVSMRVSYFQFSVGWRVILSTWQTIWNQIYPCRVESLTL